MNQLKVTFVGADPPRRLPADWMLQMLSRDRLRTHSRRRRVSFGGGNPRRTGHKMVCVWPSRTRVYKDLLKFLVNLPCTITVLIRLYVSLLQGSTSGVKYKNTIKIENSAMTHQEIQCDAYATKQAESNHDLRSASWTLAAHSK